MERISDLWLFFALVLFLLKEKMKFKNVQENKGEFELHLIAERAGQHFGFLYITLRSERNSEMRRLGSEIGEWELGIELGRNEE